MRLTLSVSIRLPQHNSPFTPFTRFTPTSLQLPQSLSLLDQPLNQFMLKLMRMVRFLINSDQISSVLFSPAPTGTIRNAGVSIITSVAATISWSAPDPEDQNGVIQLSCECN